MKNLFILGFFLTTTVFIFKWMANEGELVKTRNGIASNQYRVDSVTFSNKNLEVLLKEKNKDNEKLRNIIKDREREISYLGFRLQHKDTFNKSK
jgi:hypothetical protein